MVCPTADNNIHSSVGYPFLSAVSANESKYGLPLPVSPTTHSDLQTCIYMWFMQLSAHI